jgi:uncharacterized membrane protein
MSKRGYSILFILIILVFSTIAGPVLAEETKKDKPARGIVAALRYPGMTIGPEDKVRVDYVVKNIGRSDETILFEVIEQPEGWETQVKSYGDVITGVFLAEDEDRTLTLTARPKGEKEDGKLPAGTYKFAVKASTKDGSMTEESSVEITVTKEQKTEEGIDLTTSYPVLRGPSDATFEFSLDVKNDSEEDALFNLSAKGPDGWEVSFKPAYEDKQISSLQIQASQSRSVKMEVRPARRAETGEYPVNVMIQSSQAKTEAELKVVLTGTYEIKTGTPNGLLSLTTQTGQQANISLFVRNDGSAVQKEVSFLSFKPENWEVKFEPEKLENLKPGDLKQVEVLITPAKEALVGDYSVAVSAQGEKVTDEVEFRVTVKASSAWGWIGVAIIILVIVGLAVTFRRLGRR